MHKNIKKSPKNRRNPGFLTLKTIKNAANHTKLK